MESRSCHALHHTISCEGADRCAHPGDSLIPPVVAVGASPGPRVPGWFLGRRALSRYVCASNTFSPARMGTLIRFSAGVMGHDQVAL